MLKTNFLVLTLFLSAFCFAQTTLQVPAVDTAGKGVLTQMEADVVQGTG